MNGEFLIAIEQIAKEKGIKKDILIEAIDAALVTAYKKNYGTSQNVKVSIDKETGEVEVFALKTVAENVVDELMEISIEDARKLNKKYIKGDIVEIKVTTKNFGRILSTAKQVVVSRIREA